MEISFAIMSTCPPKKTSEIDRRRQVFGGGAMTLSHIHKCVTKHCNVRRRIMSGGIVSGGDYVLGDALGDCVRVGLFLGGFQYTCYATGIC